MPHADHIRALERALAELDAFAAELAVTRAVDHALDRPDGGTEPDPDGYPVEPLFPVPDAVSDGEHRPAAGGNAVDPTDTLARAIGFSDAAEWDAALERGARGDGH